MPRYANALIILLTAWFALIATSLAYDAFQNRSWLALGTVVPFLLAIVGLIRRLQWARRLTSGLQFLIAFFLFFAVIPNPGNPHPLGLSFYQLSQWLQVSAVVGIFVLMLLPIVGISHYASHFREELW